jgi:L-cysteine/cystine lyase
MDVARLRREFPVLARVSYLNAGTNGPVPRVGSDAAAERLRAETEYGRADASYFMGLESLGDALRARLAGLLGCRVGEVALTHSTTEGVNVVLSALELGPGDELLTSDEEHPGMLAPLAATAHRTGASVRTVPWDEVPGAVGARTRLVACSHVSWVSGRVANTGALAATGAPLLLDGAQGLGAVPTDVGALGCDFYAASGQKWLCGPGGTGCLFARAERLADMTPTFAGFESLADPERAAELPLHADARRLERGPGMGPLWAWWLASIDLLGGVGWTDLHGRAADLANRLADGLAERGLDVLCRGRSTLVAWRDGGAVATVKRLAAEGIVVRDLPGRGLVRASVGAWCTEDELDRLVALVGR